MAKQKIQNSEPQDHAIAHLAVAPIRIRPEDQSEIVSQLLFGELVTVIDRKNKSWVKVKCSFDDYTGWMDPKQLIFITEKEYKKYNTNVGMSIDIASPAMNGDYSLPILMGSSLPGFDGMSFKMPDGQYVYNGSAIMTQDRLPTVELLIRVAKKYLNAPYLWGGRSPFGIDCSGFTQMVFKLLGISLPRDAYLQADLGEYVDFVALSREGDLAFFVNKEERIHHVGIMYGQNQVIHASGRVRIDTLDHEGIYNAQTKKYTHRLKFVKRIIK